MAQLEDLLGKTMTSVTTKDDDELIFTTTEGKKYKLYHEQDCCEHVYIESVVGDLSDLVGEPLLKVEESTSCKHLDGSEPENYVDFFTWTFYKFATRKGYVDVRWYGSSNGYYSERVNFCEIGE